MAKYVYALFLFIRCFPCAVCCMCSLDVCLFVYVFFSSFIDLTLSCWFQSHIAITEKICNYRKYPRHSCLSLRPQNIQRVRALTSASRRTIIVRAVKNNRSSLPIVCVCRARKSAQQPETKRLNMKKKNSQQQWNSTINSSAEPARSSKRKWGTVRTLNVMSSAIDGPYGTTTTTTTTTK